MPVTTERSGDVPTNAAFLKFQEVVILNHPDCNEMSKYYFIDMKYNGQLTASFDDNIRLLHGDYVISESPTVNSLPVGF